MVERRMEKTAFRADYNEVKKYSRIIKRILDNANGVNVLFSTGDSLYIDLRNRCGHADDGDCTTSGKFINFPSGEACIAPYESALEEGNEFGESKTKGILPVKYHKELVRYIIRNNRISEVVGKGEYANKMKKFFSENESRNNIAELGIGCNKKAVVTGNVLEDEKVGLHIAYGMSTHLGGKVDSDMHQDICYSKGCPVEGIIVTLVNKDGTKTELIKDAMLRYELLDTM
jgi:leucyl aminopeptidase (aminopeptidase T)